MELWPAIDLRGGRCVRLLQGDYERETVFGEDPVDHRPRVEGQHVHDLERRVAHGDGPVGAHVLGVLERQLLDDRQRGRPRAAGRQDHLGQADCPGHLHRGLDGVGPGLGRDRADDAGGAED